MGNTESMNWPKSFNDIKIHHDEAYRVIEEAIKLEEQERPHEAIEKYKQGINLIDKTLNIQVTFPENPDENFQKACSMIQKMKRTRGEVLTRINSIQTSPNFSPLPIPPPPTYEEATSSYKSNSPPTYVDLAKELNELKVEIVTDQAEIIYSVENVKLYYISNTGEVTAALEGHTLQIAVAEGQGRVKAFLQIGDWIYPLVPGVSPCYRTNYGAFIFPNVHSDIEGCSVGVMLPDDADSEFYEILECILHGIVGEIPKKTEKDDISTKISSRITSGALYLSQGLIKSAEKTGSLLNYSTPKIINQLQPAQQPAPVPHSLRKGLKIAETATNKAASVTGFVAEKVGCATTKLGRFLAPHIKKQGTRLLTSGFNFSEQEAASKVDGVLTVAAGAVEGFATVYRGLETSASILGSNLRDNTVQIVEYKYGNPAGEATADTLNTVGNVVTIAHNSKILTPKGIAKQTAKQTGKAIVESYQINHPPQTESQPNFQLTNGRQPNLSNELEYDDLK